MKVIEAVVCIADVNLTLHYAPGIEVPKELEAMLIDGIKSRAYRGAASKAKIVAGDDYEAKVRKLEFGLKQVGLELADHSAYVKPEAVNEMKKASAAYASAKAQGKVAELLLSLKLDENADEPTILKAIHAKLYPSKEDVLASLLS